MSFDGLPLYSFLGIFALAALVLMFASGIVYRELHAIAKRFGIPPFFLASLLVAFCTSLPELYIGIDSAVHNIPALALGNILGANILGLTVITGVIMLLARKTITLTHFMSKDRLTVSLFLSSIPAFLLIDGGLSRVEGACLVAIYIFYLYYSVSTRTHPEHEHVGTSPRGLFSHFALFALGGLLLVGASQALFSTALSITNLFALPPLIVGIFALSFSTTFPEWSFGIRSALKGKPELLIADIIGANVVNACGILGLVALITPITPTDPENAILMSFFAVGLYFIYYFFFSRKVPPRSGVLLILLYVCFVALNISLLK